MIERQAEPVEAIPGSLNVVLTVLAVTAAASLLWTASHADSWVVVAAAAVAFSFVNNTIFSLLHESVHGIFHPRHKLNEWFGRLAAAFFPTGLTLQRIFHLGHHRRNRSDAELFDYIRPGDNRLLKFVQWYGILTGVYWIANPMACLLYLFCPWILRRTFSGSSRVARQSGSDAMLSGLDGAPALRIRLEILFTLAIQIGLFLALDLTAVGWLACYAAFAVNWSSLQYADHAWTPLHVRDGAWNLRVNPLVRYLFLNYHHHKAHHQHPGVPWTRLHRYVDAAEPRPSFVGIYFRMWAGPRPFPRSGLPPDTGAMDGA